MTIEPIFFIRYVYEHEFKVNVLYIELFKTIKE